MRCFLYYCDVYSLGYCLNKLCIDITWTWIINIDADVFQLNVDASGVVPQISGKNDRLQFDKVNETSIDFTIC
jgi:hypothetical protein